MRRIETRSLYKDYGRQRALSDVSLQLVAGQVTALLGENGAGKSTLLNILAGIIRPSRGSISCDGLPLEALDACELRRSLGVLSHEPRCYADLSPRENLRLFARLYEVAAGQELDELVNGWLGTVGLERATVADRAARGLSRGMLQRLALARTLMHRPQLLFLDEPYTGLDQGGAALLTRLLTAERKRGAIIVIVSHDFAAVAPLCDQALVLSRGRLAAQREFGISECSDEALRLLYAGAN
jgi:ABC-type multidrug transport system ATPase subunit